MTHHDDSVTLHVRRSSAVVAESAPKFSDDASVMTDVIFSSSLRTSSSMMRLSGSAKLQRQCTREATDVRDAQHVTSRGQG